MVAIVLKYHILADMILLSNLLKVLFDSIDSSAEPPGVCTVRV